MALGGLGFLACGCKYFAAPGIALKAGGKSPHDPSTAVSASEFLLTDGIRNVAIVGSALSFILFVLGGKGAKFANYKDTRCAEWLVNKSYWSAGMAMFLLVLTGFLTAQNMQTKKELMTFTKMKQMGMKASFEPYELNDYLGVPRDQDPQEFFHEKFMQ
jgi:hypothetical protein